jgi:hypothetical protein
MEELQARLRRASGADLRDIMDALLMSHRKRLWASLGAPDLQAIINRTTINQLYNFLEDAFESERDDARELGRRIVERLVGLQLSTLLSRAHLKDISMFVHAALGLNPEAAGPLLGQLARASVSGIILGQSNERDVVPALSHLLRDFRVAPDCARELLREVVAVDLSRFVRASRAEGLRYLQYAMLMIDVTVLREWLGVIGLDLWRTKVSGAPPEDAFWLMWNFFQVTPEKAIALARDPDIADTIGHTAYGIGLLALCGVLPPSVRGSVAQSIGHVLDQQPPVPTKLALTLRGLLHPALSVEAERVRSSLTAEQVAGIVAAAETIESSKVLLDRVVSEFFRVANSN